MKDIHHVIKHAKFGDDRLRDSGVVEGQISAFPIDFAGRPYNTLTLACERVIYQKSCIQPCRGHFTAMPKRPKKCRSSSSSSFSSSLSHFLFPRDFSGAIADRDI